MRVIDSRHFLTRVEVGIAVFQFIEGWNNRASLQLCRGPFVTNQPGVITQRNCPQTLYCPTQTGVIS